MDSIPLISICLQALMLACLAAIAIQSHRRAVRQEEGSRAAKQSIDAMLTRLIEIEAAYKATAPATQKATEDSARLSRESIGHLQSLTNIQSELSALLQRVVSVTIESSAARRSHEKAVIEISTATSHKLQATIEQVRDSALATESIQRKAAEIIAGLEALVSEAASRTGSIANDTSLCRTATREGVYATNSLAEQLERDVPNVVAEISKLRAELKEAIRF